MKRIVLCMCALALIAVLFSGAVQAGQPKYVLRYNHVHTDNDPYHQAWLEWSDAVFKRTNGDVKIEVYHSAQLGVEEDIIEQMRSGAPIAQNSDAARMGNYVKEFAAMNCPYFVETLEEVEKLNELDSVKAWKKELEEKQGIHIFSFFYVQGYRNFLTHIPVHKPADLAGQRIRTAPAPAWQESVRALGATPVSLPYTEIYSAVQTKAVDGCEDVYVASYHTSMYEVLKYVVETQHIMLMNFSITSAEWFNSLPKEYQEILDEECQKAGKKVSYDIINKLSAEAKQNLKDKGMTIIEAKDLDMDAFREAGKKAYEVLGLLDVRKSVYEQLGKKP